MAQAGEGLSCFLVPRILGDGTGNGFRFQRLKDKLGNRSNASSEVEFVNAIGEMVGEPGAGVKTIMDMVTLTRLDCAVASSGLMRAGLAEAVHHTRHRLVFGKKLVDQPLMQRVLADMALDVAGASALSFRLARSFDEAASNKAEASFARAMTPVVKYWVCKIAPALLYEAMECLGGNGYVEESAARPLLSRGSGQRDLGRLGQRHGARRAARARPRAGAVRRGARRHRARSRGRRARYGRRAAGSHAGRDVPTRVRRRILTEQLALSAAAAELKRMGAGRIADAFIETRLAGQWRTTYGMLDARHDARLIIDTLYPPTN